MHSYVPGLNLIGKVLCLAKEGRKSDLELTENHASTLVLKVHSSYSCKLQIMQKINDIPFTVLHDALRFSLWE